MTKVCNIYTIAVCNHCSRVIGIGIGACGGFHLIEDQIIVEYGWQVLNADGFLVMEIGDGRRGDIEAIFAQYPQYQQINFYKDYVGTDRVVIARVGAPWKN